MSGRRLSLARGAALSPALVPPRAPVVVSRRAMSLALPFLALLAPACGDKGDDGPVTASIIGGHPAVVDPARRALDAPAAALMQAVAQGLVRLDGTGQIEPGLAMRWDVSDDGLYYTFRLDADADVTAEAVAARLRALTARSSRNPLRLAVASIAEIVAVTPEVIEIRLNAPQPDLLTLLAAPEFAILPEGRPTGPMHVVQGQGRGPLVLQPVLHMAEGEESDDAMLRRATVRLRGERAALAIARFASGEADFVTAGTFVDQPYLGPAALPARLVRIDPVAGLFGLAIVQPDGFLAEAANRAALAMALDRERIARRMASPAWRPADVLVATGASQGVAAPMRPAWSGAAMTQRAALAQARVIAWTADHGRVLPLRVAMPAGPGARLLFAEIARDWAAIGIQARAVGIAEDADLRLIDAVAPTESAAWALSRFSCAANRLCDEQADRAIAEGRLGDADVALGMLVPFIPIAQPLRWSLVRERLDGFRENARAAHPLDHLRGPPADR